MCRALYLIVFTTGIFAASASLPAHTIPAELKPEVIAVLQTQSSSELIKSSALQHSETTRTKPMNPAASQSGKDESGWHSTAALLSTLGLIATIALRRHQAGKR